MRPLVLFLALPTVALLSGARGSAAAGQSSGVPDGLPARVRVAGVQTLAVRSRVVFRAAPDRPHVIETILAFPQRERWRMSVEGDDQSFNRARFRLGSQVFRTEPGTAESRLLEGGERDTALRELALRRAVLFWPHTLEWKREGDVARASLGTAGMLVARFAEGEAQRPESIASETPEGEEYERYAGIAWEQPEGELFVRPTVMRLEVEGTAVWDEEIVRYDPRARFIDRFFLPPDRRSQPEADPGARVSMGPVPARIERRVELSGEGWPACWREASRVADEAEAGLAEHGLELHPFLGLELDEDGAPAALLLRIGGAGESDGKARPPAGWTRGEGGVAASLWLDAVDELRPAHVALLCDAAERAGRGFGTPYVVLRRSPDPDAAPGKGQLVLPLHE